MRFFFDRNLPIRLAKVINAFDAEHEVIHHDDHPILKPTTPDVEWLTLLGRDSPRWIIVSGDAAILKNKAERAKLSEVNLTFFCLNKQWMYMEMHEKAWKFLRVWPDIVARADVATPTIYEVSGGKTLKVEVVSRTRQ